MSPTRLYVSLITLGVAAHGGAVQAQSADWSGWQVGTDIGVSGGRSSDIRFEVDPARDTRFNYLQSPVTVDFQRERNLGRGETFALRAARLSQAGAWVFGVEGRIEAGGARQDFVLGPVDAQPLQGQGAGTLGSLTSSQDTLIADAEFKASGSLRLRAGLPLGDRIMVSAFAGPAWAQTDLRLTQNSEINSLHVTLIPGASHFNYNYQRFESSVSTSSGESVFGATGGVIADAALTGRWALRAEAGLTQYGELDIRAPGGASGGASHFTIKPLLYSANVGLSYRF